MLFLKKDFEMSRDIENLFSIIPWENQGGTFEMPKNQFGDFET